jgi:hypothetical protein
MSGQLGRGAVRLSSSRSTATVWYRAYLAPPVVSVARPTVHEDQGRRPCAVHLERQGNAIPGGGDPAHRLAAVAITAPKHGLWAS